MVLGNHDLKIGDAMSYLHDNLSTFSKKSMVTTNIMWRDKEQQTHFSQPFKFEKLPNGVGVLYLGFMYPNDDVTVNTAVIDPVEALHLEVI